MASTIKAYQFTNLSRGLEYVEIPVPVPQNNQILVEIKATGLCHTDCNIISGKDVTFFWKRPITLGHEIASQIVAIGSSVTKFKAGDWVVSIIDTEHPIPFGDVTTSTRLGYNGGFVEYVFLYESKALCILEGVTFAQAAVTTDAIATAYHAVVVNGQNSASSKIAIIGLGGLGLSTAQIASRYGAKAYGTAQAGVYACAKSFKGFPGIRFDVVVDFAGAGSTTAEAAKAAKADGRVVLVGLSQKVATLDTYEFVVLGVTLKGAAGSSIKEVQKCLQMIADKEIDPLLEEIPFDHIREGLDRLARGDVIGRLYANPTKS
ncbi:alcohol dehydrogenase [Bimuria novae-zelandiae CBS 107.79]|uniref:Alcohol dehydrogenase n=1 Tax=Bimuria novae-zelandiae CBS 107.79 TaxID=1447943 RepID=A0A6A5VPX8_9PLEO|nr:alcohol dehydrogenase [Bimuria novae-zelandiae CBS 107.79]